MKSFLNLFLAFGLLCASEANADVRLKFERTGTDAKSVKVIVTDAQGKAIEGATATLTSSHALMSTTGNVSPSVICPNVNAMDNPTIKLTFDIKGLTSANTFKTVGLDIHAFNKNGGYQKNTNDKARKFNVLTQVGKTGSLENFGSLNDIDIAANVGTDGNVHKMWSIKNDKAFTADTDYQISLTITKGSANFGCFFGLSGLVLAENEITYPEGGNSEKICPFKTSPAVGKANVCYNIKNLAGKCLTMDKDGKLTWADNNYEATQSWYFVNDADSYLIANLQNHQVYNLQGEAKTLWSVMPNDNGEGFYFIPTATANDSKTKLVVEGDSILFFHNVHSQFARNNQIYEIPCGKVANNYITKVKVTGNITKTMQYPLAVVTNGVVTIPDAPKPTSEYYIYTNDKAYVALGKQVDVTVELNSEPLEGVEGFLYFDWDKDGIFESTYPMTLAKSTTVKVTVPENALMGKVRSRIRITENGMKEADQEVIGQIFDWIVMVNQTANEQHTLNVKANDDRRGTVAVTSENQESCEVAATPKGSSTFVCWREGQQILSLDDKFQFTLDHDMQLVAYFSPNTDMENTGIEENFAEKHQMVSISAQNKCIKVETNAKVMKILVFNPNGQLVAQSNQTEVQLVGAPVGSYIVKVYTDVTDETAKILIK